MATQNTGVQWDAQGRPYVLNYLDSRGRPTGTGTVSYISPTEVHAQNRYGADPRLAAWAKETGSSPGQSLWRERGVWDPKKGEWERGFNWDNVMNIGVGALVAGPAIASAFGPGTAAPAAAAPGAAPTAAPLLVNTAAPWTATLPAAAPFGEAAIPSVTGALAGLPYVEPLVNTASPFLANLPPTPGAGEGAPVVNSLLGPPPSTPNTGNSPGTNGLSLPGNLLDWVKLGAAGVQQALNYLAQQGASEAQLQAAKDALDFAKRAYDEQNKKEQERWDANEARRVPYRQASLAALRELRRVLGIEKDV